LVNLAPRAISFRTGAVITAVIGGRRAWRWRHAQCGSASRLHLNPNAHTQPCHPPPGAAIFPWRLLSSSSSFIGWLVAYSSLLGPLLGVIVADFWLLRRRVLDVDGLYCAAPSGAYYYRGGYNPAALVGDWGLGAGGWGVGVWGWGLGFGVDGPALPAPLCGTRGFAGQALP
jgi:hypothetical protein